MAEHTLALLAACWAPRGRARLRCSWRNTWLNMKGNQIIIKSVWGQNPHKTTCQAPPQERGRREGMTGEHHVGVQLNLWHHVPPPCLDVCREDNEGDESRVGKQRPCHALKVGDDSPCL